jgi:hypothetical protein
MEGSRGPRLWLLCPSPSLLPLRCCSSASGAAQQRASPFCSVETLLLCVFGGILSPRSKAEARGKRGGYRRCVYRCQWISTVGAHGASHTPVQGDRSRSKGQAASCCCQGQRQLGGGRVRVDGANVETYVDRLVVSAAAAAGAAAGEQSNRTTHRHTAQEREGGRRSNAWRRFKDIGRTFIHCNHASPVPLFLSLSLSLSLWSAWEIGPGNEDKSHQPGTLAVFSASAPPPTRSSCVDAHLFCHLPSSSRRTTPTSAS